MSITYYVVLPFGRDDEGNLVALEPAEAPNGDIAKRRAATLVPKHAGAVAFSRAGDPATGEFEDAVILATYGEVDASRMGE